MNRIQGERPTSEQLEGDYLEVLSGARQRLERNIEDGEARSAIIRAQIEALQKESEQLALRRSKMIGELGAIAENVKNYQEKGKIDDERVKFEAKLWAANRVASGKISLGAGKFPRVLWAMVVGARLDEECLKQMTPVDRETFCSELEERVKGVDGKAVRNMLLNAHHFRYLNLVPAGGNEISVVQKIHAPERRSPRSRFEMALEDLLQGIQRGEERVTELSEDDLLEEGAATELVVDAEGNRIFTDIKKIFDFIEVGQGIFFDQGSAREMYTVIERSPQDPVARLILRQNGTANDFVWSKPNQIAKTGDGKMIVFLSPKRSEGVGDPRYTARTFAAGAIKRLSVSSVGILAKKE